MKNVFVYGSLKKKFFNHSLISENPRNRLIRKGFIEGYKLYLLWSYPGIKASANAEKLYVELYSITDEVFDMIDKMEQSAGYTSIETEDDGGKKGILYVYNGDVNENNLIYSGNWTKEDEKMKIIARDEDEQ